MAQTVTSGLQAADRLLEFLLVGLTNTHDFTDCAHLRAELVLHAFKLLTCPARELDHNVVAVRHVFVQGAVFAAGDIL